MKKFIILLVITLTIGIAPSLFVNMNVDGLTLPAFYPPKLAFPIVWTILFILMTISVYLATKEDDNNYIIYYFQLIVNMLWTFIFFGLRLRLFAFIWLILLYILVIVMMRRFYKTNKVSMYLLIPYIIWLTIAAYLNLSIYLLNI